VCQTDLPTAKSGTPYLFLLTSFLSGRNRGHHTYFSLPLFFLLGFWFSRILSTVFQAVSQSLAFQRSSGSFLRFPHCVI
jgi:hypothetical protein